MSEGEENAVDEFLEKELQFQPKPAPEARSLSEALLIYERAGARLRRDMHAKRGRLVSDFEARMADFEEQCRATVVEMRALHEQELREHDLLASRFRSLGAS